MWCPFSSSSAFGEPHFLLIKSDAAVDDDVGRFCELDPDEVMLGAAAATIMVRRVGINPPYPLPVTRKIIIASAVVVAADGGANRRQRRLYLWSIRCLIVAVTTLPLLYF